MGTSSLETRWPATSPGPTTSPTRTCHSTLLLNAKKFYHLYRTAQSEFGCKISIANTKIN